MSKDSPISTSQSTIPGTVPRSVLLEGLPEFSRDVTAAMSRAAAQRRETYLNGDGGDLGGGVSATLVVRHAANHVAVHDVVRQMALRTGDLLDVGCGTGAPASALATWLGARLHLCDQDPAPLGVASAAFGPASATTELADAPMADIVTCMDVIEHVPPGQQHVFVAQLAEHVLPGGLLALATPDEATYPGGWSGYRPHIGCLSPSELAAVMSQATGRPATVLRLAGGPFRTSPVRQSWERVANAGWAGLTSMAPVQAAAVARLGSHSQPSSHAVQRCAMEPVVAVDPARTRSTGLLGLVQL